MTKSDPKKWTSSIRRNCSIVNSASGVGSEMPALLTTASKRPKESRAVLTMDAAPDSSATDVWHATASPPSAAISCVTAVAGPSENPLPSTSPPRSATTTRAPFEPKRSACWRPIPRPAPVTITTLPSNRSSSTVLPPAPVLGPDTTWVREVSGVSELSVARAGRFSERSGMRPGARAHQVLDSCEELAT